MQSKEKKIVKNKIIKFHNINFKSDFNIFNDFLNILLIFFYFLNTNLRFHLILQLNQYCL